MADSGVLGLITGQIIGRWGNFFNCEAFGGYTDNLFAMRIKESIVNPSMISAGLLEHEIVENGVKYIQVHPTFLYESCWNLCVLAFMLWYRKRKKFDGEMLLGLFPGIWSGKSVDRRPAYGSAEASGNRTGSFPAAFRSFSGMQQ